MKIAEKEVWNTNASAFATIKVQFPYKREKSILDPGAHLPLRTLFTRITYKRGISSLNCLQLNSDIHFHFLSCKSFGLECGLPQEGGFSQQ